MIEKLNPQYHQNIYKNLFTDSQVPMLLILPDTGGIVSANQAAAKFYGYDKQQLSLLNINQINLLTREEIQQEIQRTKKLERNHFIFQHKLANGDTRDVEVYSSPVFFRNQKLLFSVIHDISDRVKAEKQVNLYAQLFTASTDMLAVVSNQHIYLAANQAYLDMLSKTKDEVVGQHTKQVLGEEIYQAYLGYFNQAITGEVVQFERRFINHQGKLIDMEIRYFPFYNSHGKQSGVVGVLRDISQKKRDEEQLAFLAHHDALTQLPNRLLLNARLEQCIQQTKRTLAPLYVLFIDLDRFKSINDSLGHKAGDCLLVSVAQRLKQAVREQDTVARVSGDEFVVIIDSQSDDFDIELTLERLVAAFHEPFNLDGHSLFVTASIGISQYPGDGEHPNELISNADAAMYSAKQLGRNQYSHFSQQQASEFRKRTSIEHALRGAIQRDEFDIVFQPQIRLFNAECLGLETLLRWHHPELGEIPPSLFIPMAEQLGLMWELGSWVLTKACEQGQSWLNQGIEFGKLAVNIAGMQLKHGDFYREVATILKHTGFPARHLEIEITEDFVMSQAKESIDQLNQLRELGVDIAIDDFGTGYSSLSYLKQLPINKLKIDRSFVNDLDTSSDNKVIISSIIALGHAMDLKVIAEGVETRCQAETLLDEGCEQAQGFLYGKPMPAEQVQVWLGAR